MDLNAKMAFSLNILNHSIVVTSSIVTQWIIMAIIIIIALILTRNLEKIPGKKQSVLEMIIGIISDLVGSNMGEQYKKKFVPFIGTLGVFLFFLNLSGLIGVEPSTKDINVTLAFALMTFVVIHCNAIKKNGVGKYLKGYFKPFAPMFVMNVIEKITVPLSLCLRLFCNMLVGSMVLALVYGALGHFAFIIPIPLHFFFDVFDGMIQMFVFMMLTMVYTKLGAQD